MNVTRTAFALVLATFALGCDTAPTDGLCLPEAGCDGIAEVAESNRQPVGLEFEARLRPQWCAEDEDISYVAEDPDACNDVLIVCQPGWAYFGNECGCGCSYVGGLAPSELERTDRLAGGPD
jgi:hypothetical protein